PPLGRTEATAENLISTIIRGSNERDTFLPTVCHRRAAGSRLIEVDRAATFVSARSTTTSELSRRTGEPPRPKVHALALFLTPHTCGTRSSPVTRPPLRMRRGCPTGHRHRL